MFSALDQFIEAMNRMAHDSEPFIFIIDYEMKEPCLFPLKNCAKEDVYYHVNGRSNFLPLTNFLQPINFQKFPVNLEKYTRAFRLVQKNIDYGNSFLLNLTFPTEIETNLSLYEIFLRAQAPYRLYFKNQFVLFSPESFVKIENGIISAFPMKGTIDASLPNAKEIILNDSKEIAEHATIVDLIRNDLSMVASEVEVKNFRYLEELITHDKTLLQVSSEITGKLPVDYLSNLGSIITRLLPAGSICGAPKDSTVRIIQEVEGYDRAFYTGVFGIFDGEVLDSAVMIRFIERSGNKLFYKSGGGITGYSILEKEYQELIDKVYVPIH